MTAGWTLDDLVWRAGQALAAQEIRAPNGRVTALPDRRLVRWYATIGLVDRPSEYRGRTALYGPRHLLQVVAVKRRQAEGRSLAEIQAELAGATDRTLRAVARIPDTPPTPAAPPTPAPSPTLTPTPSPAPDRGDQGESGTDRPEFWRRSLDHRSVDHRSVDQRSVADGGHRVVLRPGVFLVLPEPPDPDDLTEIRAAARPLLDLLARRGLSRPRPPTRPTRTNEGG